ncbi:MAG TPA: hypothetical protein DG753_08850 [Clostridium sp.]|nr:hypothetical protein [Clostridium sp.]
MNKGEELVSVIMSCYNEKIEWIRKSIDSILNQSYKNIEFVIVNDNPEYEELKEVLHEYEKKDSRVKLYFNKQNKGLIYSLNKALEISNGNYVARMDADDISYLYRLNDEVEVLKNDNVDFVMSNADIIDEYENRINNFNNFKLT